METKAHGAAGLSATVALLNLTGWGLGYLYLRLWIRWLVHFLAFAGLLALAWWSSGLLPPALWWALAGLGLLWMALDGWRLARRRREDAPPTAGGRRWAPLALALVLLLAEAAGLTSYALLGRQEQAAARAAYEAADCRTAMQHLNRTIDLYKLAPTTDVAAAQDRLVECSLPVLAENVRAGGEYAIAVTTYEAYLERYPESTLAAAVRETVAETYAEWAASLQEEGDCQAAIGKHLIVSSDYADTPAGLQAAARAADAYAQWAAQLRGEDKYQAAIEKYDIILAEYADTPAGQQAAAHNTEVYDLWARQLYQAGDYQAAVETYQTVADEYPDTPLGAEAPARAAEILAAWAGQLRAGGDYQAAIEKYRCILDDYAGTEAAQGAAEAAAGTYDDWADRLRAAGDYQTALATYQVLGDEFPDTAGGRQARAQAAETYGEWAGALRAAGSYGEAVETYQALLDEFPDAPAAAQATPLIPETLGEWARALHAAGEYEEAIQIYEVLLDDYAQSPAGGQAAAAIVEAHLQWADQLLAAKRRQRALQVYQILATRFQNTPEGDQALAQVDNLLKEAREAISAGRPCDALPLLTDFVAAGALYANEAKEALPGALYQCGLENHKGGDFDEATDLYAQVLKDYPASPQAERAQAAQQALEIDIRVEDILDGNFQTHAPLDPRGSASGNSALVEVTNDSQDVAEILFSARGPDSRSMIIEACPTCGPYVIAPLFGPRAAAPRDSIRLAPGVYTVVIISGTRRPLVIRSWQLESGKKYTPVHYVISYRIGSGP